MNIQKFTETVQRELGEQVICYEHSNIFYFKDNTCSGAYFPDHGWLFSCGSQGWSNSSLREAITEERRNYDDWMTAHGM